MEVIPPDFILAEYLDHCLIMFDLAVKAREKWCGREKKALDPQPPAPPESMKEVRETGLVNG